MIIGVKYVLNAKLIYLLFILITRYTVGICTEFRIY